MSHGNTPRSAHDLNDDDDRTGLDASPALSSSPVLDDTPEALHDDGPNTQEQVNEADAVRDLVLLKRYQLLRDLLINLDAIIYIELAALYYLDEYTALFVLRSLLQLAQLTAIVTQSSTQATPTASSSSTPTAGATPVIDNANQATTPLVPPIPIPRPAASGRPNMVLVLVVNFVCFCIHFFSSAPSAGEATRFYLHGSILIDFVGQKAVGGWRAKLRLCLMDVLVTVLQLVAVGVAVGLRTKSDGESQTDDGGPARSSNNFNTILGRMFNRSRTLDEIDGSRQSQTPNSREASIGVSHSQEYAEDVELQPLRSRQLTDEGDEVDGSVDDEPEESTPRSPLDVYSSGQAIVADINIVHTVRQQFWELRNAQLQGRV